MPLPIAYPKIVIGGLTLELKKSFLAEFMLDKAGVDVKQAAEAFQSSGPGRVAFVTQMLAACCAHQYVARHETPPTAEQWAARISEEPDPSETFRQVAKAVFEAISKAQPAAVPTQAPAAVGTGQPN
jgi:hypothetical protein